MSEMFQQELYPVLLQKYVAFNVTMAVSLNSVEPFVQFSSLQMISISMLLVVRTIVTPPSTFFLPAPHHQHRDHPSLKGKLP